VVEGYARVIPTVPARSGSLARTPPPPPSAAVPLPVPGRNGRSSIP